MMAGTTLPAEDTLPQSLAVPVDSPSFVVDTTVQVSPNVEPVSGSDADQVRAAISQAVVIGDTGTAIFTPVDQKAIPEEGGQPDDLRAVDNALAPWGPPTGYDVAVGWMPNQGTSASSDEEADQVWG